MENPEKIELINGNGREYTIDLPKVFILAKNINSAAIDHITENTGLVFEKCNSGYEAKLESSQQFLKLFLTYNFKSRYFNNLDTKNTILLKFYNKKNDPFG